jgi:hypothetical protein
LPTTKNQTRFNGIACSFELLHHFQLLLPSVAFQLLIVVCRLPQSPVFTGIHSTRSDSSASWQLPSSFALSSYGGSLLPSELSSQSLQHFLKFRLSPDFRSTSI